MRSFVRQGVSVKGGGGLYQGTRAGLSPGGMRLSETCHFSYAVWSFKVIMAIKWMD